MTEKICVFISYKREDQATAERLWQKVGEWGYDGWLDVKNIPVATQSGDDFWNTKVTEGLTQCHAMLGLVTPGSLHDEDILNHWKWAQENSRRLLLVKLQNFKPEDLPPNFNHVDHIDLTQANDTAIGLLKQKLEEAQADRTHLCRIVIPPADVQELPEPPDYLRASKTPSLWDRIRQLIRIITLVFLILAAISAIQLYQKDNSYEPQNILFTALTSLLLLIADFNFHALKLLFSKPNYHEQMLFHIYQSWVEGVLQTALKDVEAHSKEIQPNVLFRDRSMNIGDVGLTKARGQHEIRFIFNEYKSFLILGDPGAGKTIILLQLAESLLLDPRSDIGNSIPLVLNLSSWSLNPKPLEEWLEDEVWRSYRVDGKWVGNWLKDKQLVLLLDGLDEVKAENNVRADCIQAIHQFRAEFKDIPLVICSRTQDYEQLQDVQRDKLCFVLVQKLTPTQVENCLNSPRLEKLRQMVKDVPALQAMSTTPFLLNTMIYALQNWPRDLTERSTVDEWRQHLFKRYVKQRFIDNPPPHGDERSEMYLRWLATKMQAYVQTVFHLEDIQPHWMADDKTYIRIVNGLRVTYAVALTLLYTVFGWQLNTLIGAVSYGLVGALIGGLIAYIQQFRIHSVGDLWKALDLDDKDSRNQLLYLSAVPGLGLIAINWLSQFLPPWAAWLLVSAVLGWLVLPFFSRDSLDLSAGKRRASLLANAATIGVSLVIGGLVWSPSLALPWSIWAQALVMVLASAFVLLHVFAFEEQSKADLPPARPTSMRVILMALLSGLIGAVVGLGLTGNILLGLVAALTYAGLFNGLTLPYRPLVWLRIRLQNRLPLRSEAFLEAMTERQILRRMGGGYIFIHRYLLENFAGLDEVFILIDQLASDNENIQQKALDSLEQVGQPAIRPLTQSLERNDLPLKQRSRLLTALDSIQPRKGVGLILTGKDKGLPDVDWVEIPDDGEWVYQDAKRPGLPTYRISRYPITYAQFQAFIDDDQTGWSDDRWWAGLADDQYRRQNQSKPGEQAFKYGNHPRERVSWYDAMAFCRWWSWRLEALTPNPSPSGRGAFDLMNPSTWAVRLPTEYEWEKAARGREGLIYPYGNDFDASKGNTSETGIGQTSAVGLFAAGHSPYGIEEMSGNVWEWCLSDWAKPQLRAEDEDLRTDAIRTRRGGSWVLDQVGARAAYRYFDPPGFRSYNVGFRVASAVGSVPPSP